jgi:hypothetical protein
MWLLVILQFLTLSKLHEIVLVVGYLAVGAQRLRKLVSGHVSKQELVSR